MKGVSWHQELMQLMETYVRANVLITKRAQRTLFMQLMETSEAHFGRDIRCPAKW